MLYEAHPLIFDAILDRAIRNGSRYLELRRSDKKTELRALAGGSWRTIDVDDAEMAKIWQWAVNRLCQDQKAKGLDMDGSGRAATAELLGEFELEATASGHTSPSRLKLRLRWLSHSSPTSDTGGTIGLRLVEAPTAD